jgi:hypothetical protein
MLVTEVQSSMNGNQKEMVFKEDANPKIRTNLKLTNSNHNKPPSKDIEDILKQSI